MKTMNQRVTIGLEFPYAHADSNPLWRVVKSRGDNTWECVVTADSADWAGTRKVFGGEEILAAVASQTFWSEMHDSHESWWKAQEIGATVHYHNGFGQYVRGTIVIEDGEKKMRATALVGDWKAYDLPHIDAAGNLRESYNVRQIRNGETMQPNFSNMVEWRSAVGVRDGEDPRGKPAINLTPPQLTPPNKSERRDYSQSASKSSPR